MKLYRLRYSPYARKVQVLLDLLGARYNLVEVRYGQRDQLARVTARYIYVPVLLDDDGKGVVESRDICAYLLARAGGRLVPSPWEGGKERHYPRPSKVIPNRVILRQSVVGEMASKSAARSRLPSLSRRATSIAERSAASTTSANARPP
jgi:hypothetical protein